ncbi:Vps52 / Sac2 family protein [Drechmeria coniospora]|uniref:Vps52 / Sac2 family protein n=1 Tax=Drechmeria coniospora TaxID=98403 RepID=A0A151GRH9_DRECN|nr:Vps52 / Sac2 family protein [Drechmeria coniospora]KYK59706.1 Vps52 / Sac2 family protein [Drechmeria coniospora]
MWLDRLAGAPTGLSGQSTPQPGSRSYSPLPRKNFPATLSPYVTSQRPGHSPRGSSLSLASNESSTSASLLSSARRVNGSGLRQTSTTAADVPESLKTLERLLQTDAKERTGSITEEDVGFDVDFGPHSLLDLASSQGSQESEDLATSASCSQTAQESRSLSSEGRQCRPNAADASKLDDKDKSRLDHLHRSISACDNVLHSVETNLASFRRDLAAVSADIEYLQARSTALSRRLQHRQEVEKTLSPFVDELCISPDIISKISTGHIDDSWAKMLSVVDKKSVMHARKTSLGAPRSKASEELGPLLERLTMKVRCPSARWSELNRSDLLITVTQAIERVRDFLVAQIKALRSPHINAQIIQQQNFVKFKDLYTFLHKHHGTLADEISQAYMNTMRWYYLTQFGRYDKALGKLKVHTLDKNDTLGHEDTSRMAAVLSSSRVAGPPHDPFNLGHRADLLKAKNQSALSSYLAEEDQATHYLEIPFQNFNLALIDNATAEYTFLVAFFSPALSISQILRNFNYIFEPTFDLGRRLSKSLASDSFDALGILLCIRLNQHVAFELQRRRVPAVDGYVNGTNMLLWPRLQVVMDRHCESVRLLTNSLPAKHHRSGGQSKLAAAPHVVSQRFGQLLHGFLTLCAEAGDDEPVAASLQRLRSEVEAFLNRLSLSYGSDKRKSGRFLYNNYSLILTIIGDAEGKLAAAQQEHFEQLKSAHQEES